MAAYTLYDVLRTLVERVGWPTEEEKRVVLDSIREAERMSILGNLATIMECAHDYGVQADGTCSDCGRIIEPGKSSSAYNTTRRYQ